jgi:ribosomal protein L33
MPKDKKKRRKRLIDKMFPNMSEDQKQRLYEQYKTRMKNQQKMQMNQKKYDKKLKKGKLHAKKG